MESAGGEEADGRRRLAVKDDVHQHQLDSRHPSHGTCAHACPPDGNSFICNYFLFEVQERWWKGDLKDLTEKTPVFLIREKNFYSTAGQIQSITDWIMFQDGEVTAAELFRGIIVC